MPFTLTMPKLSPTMEEGTIVTWHKSEGDFVEAGDLLFEVATDKATVEHNALDEGWLRKILVQSGTEAVVNQAVAVLTEEESESIEGYEPEGVQKASASSPAEGADSKGASESEPVPEATKATGSSMGSMAQPAFAPPPPLASTGFAWGRGAEERLKASPLARKLAEEKGLELRGVQGTGPGGRIVARDLARAPSAAKVGFVPPQLPHLPAGSYEEESLTPMRKSVGKRLQEAKTFIPHFYVRRSIDAEPMVAARAQLKELGHKVSFNDFVTRACALALREHPVVNSGFNSVNQTITRYQTVDISIAVSLEGGLITPIVRQADYKSLVEISAETRDLAGKARAGKLQPEQYQGGSFTISNLGMYGVDDFIAVINPPQACILAVGGILDQPVVKDGVVVAGKIMNVTLSSDHRVVDGAAAAEFLQTLKGYLENPISLVL